MEDEIVNEIHETWRRIFDDCGGDIEQFIERLNAVEVEDQYRLVSIEDIRARTLERSSR